MLRPLNEIARFKNVTPLCDLASALNQGQAEPPLTSFPVQQTDFSGGPVKSFRAHTLFLGPSGAGLPGARGRGQRIKAAALAAWGNRPGGGPIPSVAIRKIVAAMSQDEKMADIIEQERQAEPGGSFPPQEIEASLRPAVVPEAIAKQAGKAKRRASAGAALGGDDGDEDFGPTKEKRKYKPRAPKLPKMVAGVMAQGGDMPMQFMTPQ